MKEKYCYDYLQYKIIWITFSTPAHTLIIQMAKLTYLKPLPSFMTILYHVPFISVPSHSFGSQPPKQVQTIFTPRNQMVWLLSRFCLAGKVRAGFQDSRSALYLHLYLPSPYPIWRVKQICTWACMHISFVCSSSSTAPSFKKCHLVCN